MRGGWPFKLAMHPGETLSSFLARSAFAHGSRPYGFCNLFFPGVPIWNRDIDRSATDSLLQSIESASGTPISTLRDGCLTNTERVLCGGEPRCNGNVPLLLSLGVFHRTRKRHGTQYCSECLREARPWIRQVWRFGFVLACPVHETPLFDACPTCDAPYIPHRSPTTDFSTCWRCSAALNSVASCFRIPKRLLELQSQLLDLLALDTGARKAEPPASAIELHALRSLIAVMTAAPIVQDVRRAIGLPPVVAASSSRRTFEHMRWRERFVVLESLEAWIRNWPESFRVGASAAGLTLRSFARCRAVGALAEEISRLPPGRTRIHSMEPLIHTRALRRLRRRDLSAYRTRRAEVLLSLVVARATK